MVAAGQMFDRVELTADGRWVGDAFDLGTFQVRRGYGSWGASAQLDGDALRAATLIVRDADGRPLASAPLTG